MTSEMSNEHGQTFIGGLNRVFHCNYYNAYLQTAVMLSEGAGDCQPRRLLTDAVVPLVRHLRNAGYTDEDLISEFTFCGFGKLRRSAVATEWLTPTSHYGQAAVMQGQGECSCYFNAGYIAGMTGLETVETVCKQTHAPVDWYKSEGPLHPIENYLKLPAQLSPAPARFGFPEAQSVSTEVDEEQIINAVSGLPLFGKSGVADTGLIDAFGVVLTNHFADYYNYISYESYYGMLNAGMPVELTQDVFVRCWERIGTFRGDSRFGTWLHRVAVNVVLEHTRSRNRREARVEPTGDPEILGGAARERSDEVRMDLERAVRQLPPKARAVFILHDIEGYRHREIADMTGSAPGTMRAQLHRARRLLMEALS